MGPGTRRWHHVHVDVQARALLQRVERVRDRLDELVLARVGRRVKVIDFLDRERREKIDDLDAATLTAM
jgi:hypothetical protein